MSTNLYHPTVNNGEVQIVNPQSGGTGRIVGGALEPSNVDLSTEFINLISAQTGFSVNSRSVNTNIESNRELRHNVG